MKFSVCPYSTSPTAATTPTRPAAMQTNSAPAPVAQDVTFNLLVPEVMKLICWSVSDMGRRGKKQNERKQNKTKKNHTHNRAVISPGALEAALCRALLCLAL